MILEKGGKWQAKSNSNIAGHDAGNILERDELAILFGGLDQLDINAACRDDIRRCAAVGEVSHGTHCANGNKADRQSQNQNFCLCIFQQTL